VLVEVSIVVEMEVFVKVCSQYELIRGLDVKAASKYCVRVLQAKKMS
jgi:hypothetical protein